MFAPLRIALQFLTRLPVSASDYSDEKLRESLYWYAVAGSIIGSVLLVIQSVLLWILPWDADVIVSALLLTAWVLITGALHLDGLADSADAWLGGHGDREKTLRIMKDPQCGPAGVVSIALALLVKFVGILYLQQHQQFAYLLMVPMTARSIIPLLFYTTPYARSEGLGSPFSAELELHKIWPGLLTALAMGFICSGFWWIAALAIAAVTFMGLRVLMMRRLSGTTGDTAGATIEILECVLLVGCVWSV